MIFFEGEFLQDDQINIGPLGSFFFGENPFTCGLISKGKVLGFDLHLDRLEKMVIFFYQQSFSAFEAEIKIALTKFDSKIPHYFRITFFKKKSGEISYFIHFKKYEFKEREIHARKSRYPRGKSSLPAFVKLGNYAESFHELRLAKKDGFNEVVLVDEQNSILECTTSNLFFVVAGTVYSPEIRNEVLEGVTRTRLIKYLLKNVIPFKEDNFDISKLEYAEEIWCTNSVKGLCAFSSFEQRILKKDLFKKVQVEFNEYD